MTVYNHRSRGIANLHTRSKAEPYKFYIIHNEAALVFELIYNLMKVAKNEPFSQEHTESRRFWLMACVFRKTVTTFFECSVRVATHVTEHTVDEMFKLSHVVSLCIWALMKSIIMLTTSAGRRIHWVHYTQFINKHLVCVQGCQFPFKATAR